jgi:Ca2+-binding EF-hand superfamily protein
MRLLAINDYNVCCATFAEVMMLLAEAADGGDGDGSMTLIFSSHSHADAHEAMYRVRPIEAKVGPGPLHAEWRSGPGGVGLDIVGFRSKTIGGSPLEDAGAIPGMHLLFLNDVDVSQDASEKVSMMMKATSKQPRRLVLGMHLHADAAKDAEVWLRKAAKEKARRGMAKRSKGGRAERAHAHARGHSKGRPRVGGAHNAQRKRRDARRQAKLVRRKAKRDRLKRRKQRLQTLASKGEGNPLAADRAAEREEKEMHESRKFFEEQSRAGNEARETEPSGFGPRPAVKEGVSSGVETWSRREEKAVGDKAADKAVEDTVVFLNSSEWGRKTLADELATVRAARKRLFRSKDMYGKRRFIAEEIFMELDADASGAVDAKEFSTMLSALGVEMGEAEAYFTLGYIDRDGSGLIEMGEFCDWYATLDDRTEEDRVWMQSQQRGGAAGKTGLSRRERAARAALRAKNLARRKRARVTGRSDVLRARYNLMRRARPDARADAVARYRERCPPPAEVIDSEAKATFAAEKRRRAAAEAEVRLAEAGAQRGGAASSASSAAAAKKANAAARADVARAAQELGLWSEQREIKIADEAWARAIEATKMFLRATRVGKRQLADEVARQRAIRKRRHSLTKLRQRLLEAEDIFMRFDRDCQGRMDPYEFRSMISELGIELTQQEFDRVWRRLDADGSGGVERDEFCEWFASTVHGEGAGASTADAVASGSVTERLSKKKMRVLRAKLEAQKQLRTARGLTDAVRAEYLILAKAAADARQLAINNFRKKYDPPFRVEVDGWSRVKENEAALVAAEKAGGECIIFLETTAWGKKQLAEEAERERRIRLGRPKPLPEEQRQLDAQDVFMQFDGDASGEVDRNELERMLGALGFSVGNAEFGKIMADLDRDGSGNIDMDEFVTWYVSWEMDALPFDVDNDPAAALRAHKMKRLRQKMAAVRLKRTATGELDRCRARYTLVQKARKEGWARGVQTYRLEHPPDEGIDGVPSVAAGPTKSAKKEGPKETWNKANQDAAALAGAERAVRAAAIYIDTSVAGAAALATYIEKLKAERLRREALSGISKAVERRRWEGETVFMKFDADCSGSVDWVEFGQLVECVGMKMGVAELKALLRELDTDASGDVDMDEFLTWWLSLEHLSARSRARIRRITADEAAVDKMRARHLILVQARKKGRADAIAEYTSRCRKPDNSTVRPGAPTPDQAAGVGQMTEVEKQSRAKRDAAKRQAACALAEEEAREAMERFLRTPHGQKALAQEAAKQKNIRLERVGSGRPSVDARAKVQGRDERRRRDENGNGTENDDVEEEEEEEEEGGGVGKNLARRKRARADRAAARAKESRRLEAEDTFMRFDKDASGAVDATELGDMMKVLGMELSDREIHGILLEMDEDGSGEIDMLEFTEWYCSYKGKSSMAERAKIQMLRAKMKMALAARNLSGETDVTRARYMLLQKAQHDARRKVLKQLCDEKKNEKLERLEVGLDVTQIYLAQPDSFDLRRG